MMDPDMERADRIGEHLRMALAEYAQAVGKQVEDMTPEQRQQAFYEYRQAGRHLKGAEEGELNEAE